MLYAIKPVLTSHAHSTYSEVFLGQSVSCWFTVYNKFCNFTSLILSIWFN